MHKNETLVGSREAREVLGVHVSTISRLVSSGRLKPAAKMPGPRGAFVFERDEIDRMKAELDEERAKRERVARLKGELAEARAATP